MRAADRILSWVIPLVYGRRRLTFAILTAITAFLGYHALALKPDAGFEKQIPLGHPYMKVFKQYEKSFGGANLLSVVLMRHDGDIYDAVFLDRLRKLTDATFFLPGVDRTRVSSLFTPDLTYLDIVEDGLNFGNIVPRNYEPSPEILAQVRDHVGKAGVIGRYVSNDQHGAMITAQLLEHHPLTGAKLDYNHLAGQLEDQLRARIQSPMMFEYRLKADRHPYKAGDVVYRGFTDLGWRLRFETFEATRRDDYGEPIMVDGADVEVQAVPNPDFAPEITVHIIGFAKVVGDVTDASTEVLGFFFVTLLLITGLLWLFCGSFRLSLLPLSAALAAVIWELGLLRLAGFGLDPFAILVPFLILSIGVSHGVQYINLWEHEVAESGRDSYDASVETFRRLFLPGTVAIVTDVIGFATLAFIQIAIVQEMALNAAMGMAAVIVTNKVMLPIVLSWVSLPDVEKFRRKTRIRQKAGERLWDRIAGITQPKAAIVTLAIASLALGWAISKYPDLRIGDTQAGVPELRPDSRYNQDAAAIVQNFNIGVDVLKVIAETHEFGCVDGTAMEFLDRYVWHLRNTPGVAAAYALPVVAREVRGLFNEGAPKWKILPRNEGALSQVAGRVPTSTGLQNPDCSRMPVLVFTIDHKAETIEGILQATESFETNNPGSGVHLALASGNVGVMAATNAEIRAREIVVIVWVHLTLLIFVWLSFRSIASVICIITPLVLCSLLTYAFMASWGIGMKAATLPVAAFGVGIGVDDGIYLWGMLSHALGKGATLREGFRQALRAAGKATTFTSLALIVSVGTWLFSGLQFQADMGLLLLFMFTTNLFGAILLMPALGWLCNLVMPMNSGGGFLVKQN